VEAELESGQALQHVCEVQVTLNEIADAKHEMHKYYTLVRSKLYTELNLSTVQRGPQSVDLDDLRWVMVEKEQ
jgi:hypothetical protein